MPRTRDIRKDLRERIDETSKQIEAEKASLKLLDEELDALTEQLASARKEALAD